MTTKSTSNKPTTVLYYEPSSGFGGSSSNLYHILKRLDRTRFKPLVVTHKDGAQFERIQTIDGVTLEKIPFEDSEKMHNAGRLKMLWVMATVIYPFARKLAQYIRDHQVDVIHINTNIMLGLPMIIAGRMTGKPVFCYIRESRAISRIERMHVKDVQRFFILNHQAFDIYKTDIPEDKLEIIYDGVDLSEFEDTDGSAFREEFQLDGQKLVGMVGRIVQGKGHIEFVKAAQLVCQQVPNTKFVIVGAPKGDGVEYFEEVKAYINANNLGDQIVLTGWRTDAKEITSALDILVLASTTFPEGLPNSIIEAMAMRKPAIATDIPGPPEIIDHAVTGYIVPPGDVETMAHLIHHLLEHSDEAEKMGLAGRERAERLFDVNNVARRFEELYLAAK